MHLVDDYCPRTGFFFGTHDRSLLAQGQSIVLPGRGAEAPQRAEAVLDALGGDNLIVGAVPFDDDSPAHLVVPEKHTWGDALQPQASQGKKTAGTVVEEVSRAEYQNSVSEALEIIDSTSLSKVVLARPARMQLAQPIPVPRVLRQLRNRQLHGFVFGCATPGGGNLVGGSPELLVRREGNTVTAHPLAGSRPRGADAASDEQRFRTLFNSDKDRREHAMVVDDIVTALTPFCTQLDAPNEPSIVTTPQMIHLGTKIVGTLKEPYASSLTLGTALHPTPAICGTPTRTAREAIRDLESFDRKFYSGMVGWCDSQGNGEWAVTIRCAELYSDHARLYAGAGIVAGSTPQSEWDETSAKLETMITALSDSAPSTTNRSVPAAV